MMVVPIMAAAGVAAARAPNAQAADDLSNLDDTCLECAGIGIVPCTSLPARLHVGFEAGTGWDSVVVAQIGCRIHGKHMYASLS